jgi:hypothetical protein
MGRAINEKVNLYAQVGRALDFLFQLLIAGLTGTC